jgi:hypothetical protein
MDHSEPTASGDRAWAPESSRSAPSHAERHAQPGLTRAQRWLAWATAIAVLMSGLNALVQVGRVASEYFARHG